QRGVVTTYAPYRSSLLQRTIQYRRSFHQGDHVKQDDERTERERNRDRPRASAALLLFAEHNSLRLFVHVTKALTPRGLSRRPRPATPRRGRLDRGWRKRRDRAPRGRRARLHARDAPARRTRPSARRRGVRSPRRSCGHSREATGPHRSARARWNRAESVASFPPARLPP